MGKKRRMSEETKVRLSAIELIKSEKPLLELSALRFFQHPSTYPNLLDTLERFPNNVTNIIKGEIKRTIKQLNSPHLTPIDINNEITWAKVVISRNISTINAFRLEFENYSNQILNGQYEQALEILDQIEDRYGYSLWVIKNKIAVLQKIGGLEEQKKYVNYLKKNIVNNSLVKFIIHWVSIRNEDNTSMPRFEARVRRLINKLDKDNQTGYIDYSNYHILGEIKPEMESFCNVLRMEYSRSIIDYYFAFIELLKIAMLSEDLRNKSGFILRNLNGELTDPIINFLDRLKGDVPTVLSNELELIDNAYLLFLSGDHHKAVHEILQKDFCEKNNSISLFVAALAYSALDEKTRLQIRTEFNSKEYLVNLIIELSNVIRKGIVGAGRSVNELKKRQVNFASCSWSSVIKLILRREGTLFYYPDNVDALLATEMAHTFPILLNCFKNTSLADQYRIVCETTYAGRPTAELEICNFNKQEIPISLSGFSAQYDLYNCFYYFDSGMFSNSIELGLKLASSEHEYYKRKGIGLVTHSFLEQDDLLNACIYSVSYYLENKEVYSFLPISEITANALPGTENWNKLYRCIEFPILLDVYTKLIDPEGHISRSYAYEDFLYQNGMKKPSELLLKQAEFENNKLVYYLREICIEANMDTSDAFENGSEEIISERLAVVKILLNIDPRNKEVYDDEIHDIIRKQIIARKRKEVDNSRIYVDVQAISNWARIELKESYERYVDYVKHGLKLEFSEKKSSKSNDNIKIPENEVTALLASMVEEIIAAYLSPEFGLDRFLSTRIRHGIMEGHLRRPLQQHNLITKRKSEKGNYLRNDFLLEKLIEPKDPRIVEQLDNLFSSFSRKYDDLIFEITDEWIQVQSSRKPSGLFEFAATDEFIIKIAETIKENTSIDEFIGYVLNSLDQLLILNLARIREVMNSLARPRIKRLIQDFHTDISKYQNQLFMTEIDDVVAKSRTAIQNQLDKIIGWFVPSSTGNSPPFYIDEAVIVAETIIKEGYPKFNVDYEAKEEKEFEIHGNLPKFVDIFVNIFDNVVKRADLELPCASVIVELTNPSSELRIVTIRVSNEIGGGVAWKSNRDNLMSKKLILDGGDYDKHVAKDRNSGLFKIHKNVMEFGPKNSEFPAELDFDIDSEGFWIEFSITFKMYSLELDDE